MDRSTAESIVRMVLGASQVGQVLNAEKKLTLQRKERKNPEGKGKKNMNV